MQWLRGALLGAADHGSTPAPPERPIPAGWPGPRSAAELLRETPELHQILARLGFLPRAEERWPALIAGLEGSVTVEIPDYSALREELEGIRSSFHTPPAEDDLLARARWARRQDPLLQAVLASLDEPDRVRWLLSRKPVREALPLVEEIPFLHQGEISWRRPMEIPLIRKRPRDPQRFTELLDAVENLLVSHPAAAGPPERHRAQREALDALARLRRALDRENAYIPAPLLALEERVTEWLRETRDVAAVARRGDLEEILAGLAEARHRVLDADLSRSGAEAWNTRAQTQVARYLETSWMHTPWLTLYALATLLATELAQLERTGTEARSTVRHSTAPQSGGPRSGGPREVLHVVWGEVASQRFDAAESIRRLRQLEGQGIYVHSLVYTLLKMSRRPDDPRD